MSTTPYPLTGPDPDKLADGSPRPRCPQTGKPLMTLEEANWHSHVSGMAARSAAESQGDPIATAALLDGAAGGGPVIGRWRLQPLTIGTFNVLQLVGSAHAKENPDGQPIAVGLMDIARAALIFAKPEWSYACLRPGSGKLTDFEAEVVELSFLLDPAAIKRANDWIEAEMREFFGEDTSAKKSPSPEPLPPEPAESPASPGTTRDLPAAGSPH